MALCELTPRQVIADEADRILTLTEEGEKELRAVLQCIVGTPFGAPGCPRRQTVMVSATFPPALDRICRGFMLQTHTLTVSIGEVGRPSATITQHCVFVASGEAKNRELIKALREGGLPALVFVNERHTAEAVGRTIERAEELDAAYTAEVLHAGKTPAKREQAFAAFRGGATRVLVATPVASRGLDIPNIAQVINYDAPRAISDYVHQIGRTGRMGAQGRATTFLTAADSHLFADLRTLLKECGARVPAEIAKEKP